MLPLFSLPAKAALSPRTLSTMRFRPVSQAARPLKRSPSAADLQTFSDFRQKTSTGWRVRYSPLSGAPEALIGGSNLNYSGAPQTAALKFISDNAAMLKVDVSKISAYKSARVLGINHLYFKQYQDGIPVENSSVKVHIKDNGDILYYTAKYIPSITVSLTPTTDEASAKAAVIADGAKPSGPAEKVIWQDESTGTVYLVWKITATTSGSASGRWRYYVDAHGGTILNRISALEYSGGTVTGNTYTTYPHSSDFSDYTAKPMPNQYVWTAGSGVPALTNASGVYSDGNTGKVFSSLQGPYFSVSDAQGASAHYDNGGSSWTTVNLPTPARCNSYTVAGCTVTADFSSLGSFYQVRPQFDAGFDVGAMDIYGNITNADEVYISSNAAGGPYQGLLIGQRAAAFYGAAVTGSTVTVKIIADNSVAGTGFTISSGQGLKLNAPTTAASGESWLWTSSETASGNLDEINAFYHLNAMRSFFNSGVNIGGNVNLDFHLPVAVRAHGDPDHSIGGMENAFYDLDHKNMMIGEGDIDDNGHYRSFALDAGIVRHEYTHAVVDRIFPIYYSGESGAISEAMSDYFALSSLRGADADFTPLTSKFGEFFSATSGEGVIRNLADDCTATTPANCVKTSAFVGEVHDDSLMLSQALWRMRNVAYNTTYLGTITLPGVGSTPRSDVYVWYSLFFFPETFQEFYDAMNYVSKEVDGSSNVYLAPMNAAFTYHVIPATRVGTDSYEPNDSTQLATDISTMTVVNATISPAYDVDFYSLDFATGTLTVNIGLPPATQPNTYHAYTVLLQNINRKTLASVTPPIDPDCMPYGSDTCPNTGECFTRSSSATLSYAITSSGRYIIGVSAGPNTSYFNGPDTSTSTYTLTLAHNAGSADASKTTASFDSDEFTFSAPYNIYYYNGSLVVSSGTAEVETYDHAQLLDHNMQPLEDAVSGDLLSDGVITADTTTHRMSGTITLNSGFAARYPAVGTVYLQIYGMTKQGAVVSLGRSGALSLTANVNSATPWNNIFNPNKGEKMTLKYSLLSAGTLSAKLYTLDGMLVKTLYDGPVPSGSGAVDWTGVNESGNTVASGLYLLRVKAPGIDKTAKVVVLR